MLFKDFKPVMCLICTLRTIFSFTPLFPPSNEQRFDYMNMAAAVRDERNDFFFFMFAKCFCVLTMLQQCVEFGFLMLYQKQ